MQQKQPTHISLTVQEADELLALIQDVPTRWGHAMIEVMKKAQPLVIPEAKLPVDDQIVNHVPSA